MIKCPNCQQEIANREFLNSNMASFCPNCKKRLTVRPSLLFLFFALFIFGLFWDTLPFFTNMPGGWIIRFLGTLVVAVLLIGLQIIIGYGRVEIIKDGEKKEEPK